MAVVIPITEGGLVVPLESCANLGLQLGDVVELRSATSSTELTETEHQVEIAKQIMVERYGMLERLAHEIMGEDSDVLRRLAE